MLGVKLTATASMGYSLTKTEDNQVLTVVRAIIVEAISNVLLNQRENGAKYENAHNRVIEKRLTV